MGRIDARLAELGITIPDAVPPVATYIPFTRSGALVFISGQISISNGALIKGSLGAEIDLEKGVEAARACGINLIAQMKSACDGDLDRVVRIIRLGGFVSCTADFQDHPKVVNGASDLMVSVFGDIGRHCRAAVGAPSLPLGAAVEIEATIEVK